MSAMGRKQTFAPQRKSCPTAERLCLTWQMQRNRLPVGGQRSRVTKWRKWKTPRFDPPSARGCCELGRPRSVGVSLRPRKQQREQLGPARAIDDPVDEIGPEAALECNHRFLFIGDVVSEPLEGQQEAGVGPIRVDEVTRWTGEREPSFRELPPGKQLPRIFLSRGRNVGMTDNIPAADAVPL